jgi:cytoskeletal protein RodZ
MKLLNRLSILILLVVAISSCNVNNGFIQKRKYQKGYHLSMKKKINNSDNIRLKDNQLEKKDELAKESLFSKASEKSNGAVIKTGNTNTDDELTNSNETTIEDVTEKAIANNSSKEKINHIKTNTKNLAEQIKSVIENQSIVKNNTASKSKSNDDSDLITLILIILLVILALALFALIDGLLGGLLSLILLIIIIVLLLQYFGVI